jgi:hypothetical protein
LPALAGVRRTGGVRRKSGVNGAALGGHFDSKSSKQDTLNIYIDTHSGRFKTYKKGTSWISEKADQQALSAATYAINLLHTYHVTSFIQVLGVTVYVTVLLPESLFLTSLLHLRSPPLKEGALGRPA